MTQRGVKRALAGRAAALHMLVLAAGLGSMLYRPEIAPSLAGVIVVALVGLAGIFGYAIRAHHVTDLSTLAGGLQGRHD